MIANDFGPDEIKEKIDSALKIDKVKDFSETVESAM